MWPLRRREPEPVPPEIDLPAAMVAEWVAAKTADAEAMMARAEQELRREMPDPKAMQRYRLTAIRDRLVERRPFVDSALRQQIDQKITQLEAAMEEL